MDTGTIATIIGTGIGIVGFVYAFLRNFKTDINSHIDIIEKRTDALEERMFWMATGKRLEDAILEERLKREPKTNP